VSALAHHVALVCETESVSFGEVRSFCAALQKQVTQDFKPTWDIDATIETFRKGEHIPAGYWHVRICDATKTSTAAGYHLDADGKPYSVVRFDPHWRLNASHETLEMLADPLGTKTIEGPPPPQAQDRLPKLERVLYLVEICDPCQSDRFAYETNGELVSDFVTPHYYHPNGATGVQYSVLGNVTTPHTVLEGGYVTFFDPVDQCCYQVIWKKGGKAEIRKFDEIKSTNGKNLRELVDTAVRGASV